MRLEKGDEVTVTFTGTVENPMDENHYACARIRTNLAPGKEFNTGCVHFVYPDDAAVNMTVKKAFKPKRSEVYRVSDTGTWLVVQKGSGALSMISSAGTELSVEEFTRKHGSKNPLRVLEAV
jgi:hypothetical protein